MKVEITGEDMNERRWLSRTGKSTINAQPSNQWFISQREPKRVHSCYKENEKPNFLFFYRFFELFLLEPGIFLLFISPLEAHQFFFTGFEAEIPP